MKLCKCMTQEHEAWTLISMDCELIPTVVAYSASQFVVYDIKMFCAIQRTCIRLVFKKYCSNCFSKIKFV